MEPRYLSRSSEQATDWKIRSLNPDRGSYFLFSTTANSGAGAHSTQPHVSWHRCSFAEVKQPGMNLAIRLFLYREWERMELYLYLFECLHVVDKPIPLLSERTDILYLCIALMCAEYQSGEVLFSLRLRPPTSCLFLELSK